MKEVDFRGSSLADLRNFDNPARRECGYQIEKVQKGEDPADWKPMATIGPGVKEIRVKDENGIYRVIYVAKFGDTVHVLHCFKKKTQKTRKLDKDLASKRYKELVKELQK